MALPNFLIIGAAKAGTTSLYDWLNQHPQIYMTPIKETNFFAFEGEKISYPKGSISEGYLDGFKTSFESYMEQFQGVTNEIAIGEASPSYLYHAKAAARIKYYCPDVKLIAILRDPVERAYSQFLHHAREGFENCLDFSAALREEDNRILNKWWWGYFYVDGGFYYTQLQRYFEKFDSSKIKVYLYEDLRSNRYDLIKDIFQFLEVDDNFIPDTSTKYNVTGIPKNKFLHELLSKQNFLKTSVKAIMPQGLRRKLAMNLKNANLVKPEFSLEIRKQLIEIYREDILKLQNLIQRDISSWLQ
ncbi:MAG: sulfotransferase [Microcystis sp. M53603_WE2]|jgi:hypothetical protein|uniref:sulfotransferase family protein n=1 Tax=unclassified Microcystis TaxID=2643300 RepID=UPI0022BDAD16|nr:MULTISPECIES: sulfotransferase [unclassified Microcystis]MCE2661872.1 sulfotransferase domain-containing protein [Microcystis sp. 53602_E8]MDJ0526319.1 sulfotransferase [Microcystis sp. M53600_WE12]MDJ0564061.1 sulfotransferase [Microcystis sp. M49629_WE12]MCZ8025433.1 sulfotransferase [Microcystis sp. LE19-10.1B]MDJ0541864.1 sulfotransferase [Microcystis sp. M53603_WE2]